LSQKLGGDLSPKPGEVVPNFDSRFGGIEATVSVNNQQDQVDIKNSEMPLKMFIA